MMDPLPSSPSNGAGRGRTCARRDLRQRDIVDDALALMRVAGTVCALEYLKSRGVDSHVIARVLLDPRKRRGASGLGAA